MRWAGMIKDTVYVLESGFLGIERFIGIGHPDPVFLDRSQRRPGHFIGPILVDPGFQLQMGAGQVAPIGLEDAL